MDDKPYLVRVKATFEFVGLLPDCGFNADPEKAVEQKFKFFGTEISGFVLEKKTLKVWTQAVELPQPN